MNYRTETAIAAQAAVEAQHARFYGVKIGNDYAAALGDVYEKAPKAVLAAVLVSYAMLLAGEGTDAERLADARAMVLEEWGVLYHQDIVPQKPPRGAWGSVVGVGGTDRQPVPGLEGGGAVRLGAPPVSVAPITDSRGAI